MGRGACSSDADCADNVDCVDAQAYVRPLVGPIARDPLVRLEFCNPASAPALARWARVETCVGARDPEATRCLRGRVGLGDVLPWRTPRSAVKKPRCSPVRGREPSCSPRSGAMVTIAITFGVNAVLRRDFARELAESVRVKHREPLGEETPERLLEEEHEIAG